jgi:ferredoxin-type protein NapF
LVRGDGGFPEIDFSRGECSFCGECERVCAADALTRSAGAEPWQLRATIGDTCIAARGVECRVCGESCGAAAIRFPARAGGVRLPDLDSERCTGCGACVAPCPVSAIAVAHFEELPA